MLRKTLAILSLIGLLLSVGLWATQGREPILLHTTRFPESEFVDVAYELGPPAVEWSERGDPAGRIVFSGAWTASRIGPSESSGPVYFAALHGGHLRLGRGTERLTIFGDQCEDNGDVDFQYARLYSAHYSIPLWLLALLFMTVSCFLVLVPFHRRRKRRKLGLCLRCGYNLNRLSELRCPECGQEFETT